MGRGVYRGVHSSLFDDPDFQQLSAHARQVFLTIRLCKDAGPAVIFRYYPEVIARQTGLSLRQVEAAMLELERPPLKQPPWIIREGVVVWVRNGLRHDPNLRLGSAKHRSAVIRQLQGLPRGSIIARFCEYYEIAEPINSLSDSGSKWPPNPNPNPNPNTDTESDRSIVGQPPDVTPLRDQAREILTFLNDKAGRRFEPVPENLKLIEARLKAGASAETCRGVIVRKVRAWATDPKMAAYLRPATLFNATKFAQYVGEQGRPS